jgi:hypothetical protein
LHKIICENCKKEKIVKYISREPLLYNDESLEIDNYGMMHGNRIFCSYTCINEYYKYCVNCGTVVAKSEILCNRCKKIMNKTLQDEIRDNSYQNYLLSYSYKPKKVYYRTTDKNNIMNTLFFGTEFELTADAETQKKIVMHLLDLGLDKSFYCVHDGSISGGLEIIVHPYTWSWYNSKHCNFNVLFDLPKMFNCNVNSNCGLHMHMSKSAFTRVHLFKALNFIYSNIPYMLYISGRDINRMEWIERYCCISRKRESGLSLISSAKNKIGYNKYQIINLKPKNTIEIRIFNGTIDSTVFRMYIEFCKSLYDFTKEYSIKDINLKEYLNFIDGKKEFKRIFYKTRTFITTKSLFEIYNKKIKNSEQIDMPINEERSPVFRIPSSQEIRRTSTNNLYQRIFGISRDNEETLQTGHGRLTFTDLTTDL